MKKKYLSDEKIDYVISLYSKGQIKDTLNEIHKLNERDLLSGVLLNIQGACYNNLGLNEKASISYKAAIGLEPNSPVLYYNLGNTHKELNQPKEAIHNYKIAISIEANYIEAIYNLGATLQELGNFYDAKKQFQSLLMIDSKNINAKLNLGFIYQHLDQIADALIEYEEILKIEPFNEDALNNLGIIFRDTNQSEESIKFYKKAIEANPNYSGAYYNLAFTYQDIGQIENAIENYEKSIALDHNPQSYHNLSYLKDFENNGYHIKKMNEMLEQNNLPLSHQIQLSLALAKSYEKLGMQDEFFEFLNKGNMLQKKESKYNFNHSRSYHNSIIKLFKENLPTIKSNINKSDKNPIFIVGMPRSGTSLIEQIISSHSLVYGAGELDNLTKLASPIIKNYESGDIGKLNYQALSFIHDEYLDSISSFEFNERFFTDKLPLNFQYIGIILLAFPNAKIVHVKRDARATCWSNYKYYFQNKENGYSNDFEDLVNFYGSYIKLMNFWNELFPNQIFELCYEDLTKNQEKETRKLLDYCKLDWDEKCLDYHKNERAVKTVSALQVRKKIYQDSSLAWKQHWAYIQPLIDGLKSY